ncbi:uncharacterized protein BX663DRAFT_509639 [Cokeromyces recurvatus]|uniref:uncharacterized protein n=1 Tax=Cokeromyces recurvatus TaxID=90255 RepID=UPI00221F497A|nr:uncharacterized protein BX663DRAFT_509639 [Cokeromyces recurvatus]KAI7902552.1 hypothetical protein BX663DRAFT_509639 [Cokeromyces recurvatus]
MGLIEALIQHGYFASKDSNQGMIFGELPEYIRWLEPWVLQNYPGLFDSDILNRKPIFDQAILNMYKKGEGIASHVDLLRFEDGILIISLLSSCVMTMKNCKEEEMKYDILLRPGDILALSKEARYDWEHGIEERLYDEIEGEIIERGTRISVTLRKLKQAPYNTEKTELSLPK